MPVETAKGIADKAEMSGPMVHLRLQGLKGQRCLAFKEGLFFL